MAFEAPKFRIQKRRERITANCRGMLENYLLKKNPTRKLKPWKACKRLHSYARTTSRKTIRRSDDDDGRRKKIETPYVRREALT